MGKKTEPEEDRIFKPPELPHFQTAALMISDKKPYNAEIHAKNQKKHGSWVLHLITEAPVPAGE
jgi:hypothetical protein